MPRRPRKQGRNLIHADHSINFYKSLLQAHTATKHCHRLRVQRTITPSRHYSNPAFAAVSNQSGKDTAASFSFLHTINKYCQSTCIHPSTLRCFA